MKSKLKGVARAAAVLALGLSTMACATVTRGTKQAWTVQTNPGGAAVQTSHGFSCEATPCTFKMNRNSAFTVTITKPGYKTVESHVIHQTSGGGAAGMAGNVIVGGLIGVGVDAASGATQDLVPNPLIIDLEPLPGDGS